MKQNCKQSAVMINDQQDKKEILFDVEILILIDSSCSVLKHNSYARGYHTYMDICIYSNLRFLFSFSSLSATGR